MELIEWIIGNVVIDLLVMAVLAVPAIALLGLMGLLPKKRR
jgi:hypothetical protein